MIRNVAATLESNHIDSEGSRSFVALATFNIFLHCNIMLPGEERPWTIYNRLHRSHIILSSIVVAILSCHSSMELSLCSDVWYLFVYFLFQDFHSSIPKTSPRPWTRVAFSCSTFYRLCLSAFFTTRVAFSPKRDLTLSYSH